ncbi:MAG: hypothetical protein J0L92_26635 [Deltaproteobacteria bacterium]|nr:hypothetical protein [Deltaproteobacteria bacterium]
MSKPCRSTSVTSRLLGLGMALSCIVPSATTLAHGREASVGLVAFDPSDRDHFLLRGTWAFLTTHDDGASFRWTCADAAGFDRFTEDPAVMIGSDARVLVGTFDGLRRSNDVACEYVDAVGDVGTSYIIDLQPDTMDPRVVWAVRTPGDAPNTLLRSEDDGATFAVAHEFEFGILLDRVRVAPSDPRTVYVSGAAPRRGDTPRRAMVLASFDGAETFTTAEIPLLDGERSVHVLAVDPANPRRALFRMTRTVTDTVPERLLLTEDGGSTYGTVLEMREIVGLTFSHDGERVWAGSWDGGLARSDDAGATWTLIDPTLRVRCLAERSGVSGGRELFVCVDELTEPYAVARSYDDGHTLEEVWGFHDISNDLGCSGCTAVGAICPTDWADVLYDIASLGAIDAGPSPDPLDVGPPTQCEGGTTFDAAFPDAAVVSTTPPASCACSVGPSQPRPISSVAWLALLAALARRRLRRS